MALPADTALETAFGSIEAALANDFTIQEARTVIGKWREVVQYIEGLGGTGYTALTQRDWGSDILFGIDETP